jgi:type II secretory pathway pseudopilin PulG
MDFLFTTRWFGRRKPSDRWPRSLHCSSLFSLHDPVAHIRELESNKAFTSVELLVVIAAIAILTVFFVPTLLNSRQATAHRVDTLLPGTLTLASEKGNERVRLPGQAVERPVAIPTLTQVWSTNASKDGVSGFCHALLFYGLGPTDIPGFPSGESVLNALTDEQTATRVFGRSPFIRTRNGLRYLLSRDPVFNTDVGEAHRDQCLATFAALNLPLATPIRLEEGLYSISNLLSESLANFSFDQAEPAWTAMAFAKYLPPKTEWSDRFGERTSFSELVQKLMAVPPSSQSCAGTHIFQALVQLDRADQHCSILVPEVRRQLDSYLNSTIQQVVSHQLEDGSWGMQWCDAISSSNTGRMTVFESRLLVTGHLLEPLNALSPGRRPPGAVYDRAAAWLTQALNSREYARDDTMLCPFTHAARTTREILKRSVDVGPGTFSVTRGSVMEIQQNTK